MPKPVIPSVNAVTSRKIRDVDDRTLLDLGVVDAEVPDAQGIVQKRKQFISRVLVNGVVYHAGMPDRLVTCNCCLRGRPKGWFRAAEPPNHGCLLEVHSVRCSRPGCGAACCPRHALQDAAGNWLCRDCAERWNLRGLLGRIFFRQGSGGSR